MLNHNQICLGLALGILVTLSACQSVKPFVSTEQWRPVKTKLLGISGIVSIALHAEQPEFLIVHDSKGRKVYTAKITLKERGLEYDALDWHRKDPNEPNDTGFTKEPFDLEALTRVPGDESFMALASKGIVYHIRIAPHETVKKVEIIQVLNEFKLPNPDDEKNLEGFSLQAFGGDTLAVWAYRGNNKKPGRIYWGLLQPTKDDVIFQDSAPLVAPWPIGCRQSVDGKCSVRHVSDLRVDPGGLLYVSSAAESNDDGPFDSAVYIAGKFERTGNQFALQLRSPLTELFRCKDRKVEAIEILGGHPLRLILGSDDENQGGSVLRTERDCG